MITNQTPMSTHAVRSVRILTCRVILRYYALLSTAALGKDVHAGMFEGVITVNFSPAGLCKLYTLFVPVKRFKQS